MCVPVADTESQPSPWKLWGTLRLHPSGAKAPHLQTPVVCLITFSQALGNRGAPQRHHAHGLMRFPNPMLWNCHRLFVRKWLPCESSSLKIWGTHILIVILRNYKKHRMTSITCNKYLLSIHFTGTWASQVFLFPWAPWRDWKVRAMSLNLRMKGWFPNENRDLTLKWIDQFRFPFPEDELTTLCSYVEPFYKLLYSYHSFWIHSF